MDFRKGQPGLDLNGEWQFAFSDRSSARMTLHFYTRLSGPFYGADAPQYEIEIEGRHEDSTFTARERLLFSSGRIGVNVRSPHLWWSRGRGDAALYVLSSVYSRTARSSTR